MPIVFLHLEYDKLRDDTLLIEYDEGLKQFFILDSMGESPFVKNELFVVSVPGSFYEDGLRLVLDSNLYFTNIQEKPLYFEISFDNGNTWTTFDWGDTLSNSQSLNSQFNFKAHFTGNAVRKSIMSGPEMITCNGAPVPQPAFAPWNPFQNQFINGNVIADFTQSPGGPALGNAYTWFRPNPSQGEENLYKKPIIIVEGFELGDYSEQNAANYQMGDFGWCGLWGNGDYPLDNMPDLLNDLHDNGYDIIMLDFKHNRIDIKENAYVLIKLLNLINEYKTPDAEPNVVIGASMGGLISRYGLRWMEMNGMDHCTRLYISLDAPHKGAYISVGALHMINHLATNNVRTNANALDRISKLNSKAARQMLIHNIMWQSDVDFNDFYDELDVMGYPQMTKNISIASGSKGGNTMGLIPGQKLLEATGNYWTISFRKIFDAKYYALPGSQYNLIYHGIIAWGISPTLFPTLMFGPRSNVSRYFTETDQTCYDMLAGGYRRTALEMKQNIEDEEDWIDVDVIRDRHSFVPLVSALDLNTTNWFYDASNLDEDYPDLNLTPFSAIYAPEGNTEHVEITDGLTPLKGNNIEFALRHIKEGGSLPLGDNTLTTTYNYGTNTKTHITHELVENGGKMLIYGNQGNGDGSGSTPPSGNTHIYNIGNGDCYTKDLTIGNNGELIIGESSVNNIAELYVNEGSSLIIEDGGKIIVQDGSKLIIEDGGNIEYLEDAEIELQGPNSILEIRGKVTVGDNATFTFSGEGRIVIDQFIYSGVRDNFWDIGENAKLVLEGPSPYSQVLLECKSNFSPVMENHHTFEEVTIKRGKVYMGYGKHMSITAPLEFRHIEMDINPNHNPALKHNGLKLWGTHNGQNLIMTNRFYNATNGITSNQLNATEPLNISQCTFENNGSGIKINSKNFNIVGCDFKNNSGSGIYCLNIHGQSTIKNCTFESNFAGVFMIGQSGAEVLVSECDFENIVNNPFDPTSGITAIEGGHIRLECSEIKGFYYGLQIEFGSSLDISHDAHNSIHGNEIGLTATSIESLSMIYGNNNFENIEMEVYLSHVAPNYYSLPILDWHIYNDKVDFSGNRMRRCPAGNCPPNPSVNGGWYNDLNYGNTKVYTYNPDYDQTFHNCVGSPSLPAGHLEVRMIENFETEVNINFTGSDITNLKEAVEHIADYISQDEGSGEESTAIDLFSEISPQILADPNLQSSDLVIYKMILKLSQKALAKLYGNEELPYDFADGNPPSQEVIDVVYMIDNLINHYGAPQDTSDYDRQISLILERIFAYRQGGFYPQVLNELSESSNIIDNASPRIIDRWSYWNCVCHAENNFLTDSITEDLYEEELSICNSLFSPSISNEMVDNTNQYDPEAITEASNLPELFTVFPNPASEEISFKLENPIEYIEQIDIYDLSGRLIEKIVYSNEDKMSQGSISISHLSSGSYIIRAYGKTSSHKGRFNKR